MKRLLILLALVACNAKPSGEASTLAQPTDLQADVQVQQGGDIDVLLSWKDNCSNEEGYYVFLSTPASKPFATLPAGSTSYLFEKVAAESEFVMGVQAFGKNGALSKMATLRVVTPSIDPVIPEPDPSEAIRFHWTAVEGLDLPASVQVFKTTDALEGKPFNAWYAIADCSAGSDVCFRVLYPGGGKKATIDQQASAGEKCLVLINGGIFGTAPIGFALLDGVQTPWRVVEEDNWAVDKQYWGAVPGSAYEKLHPVSRGLFGVDSQGVPGVFWSFTPAYGTVYVYDQPIPTVAGEAVQPEGSLTFPCPPSSWVPYNAITCGPVLLKDGKCPITAEKTAKGYWKTNYELWADDIYGVGSKADRTAVGYLADGHIVLLVCDGRIAASEGATTLQMAKIMHGLGCVGALNLDGGGSTGIWASGKHLNDLTGGNRPVMTTLGFFSR